MSEEKEKCCCGCEQTGNVVDEQAVVEKFKKRNLISAVILLILAVIFVVWHCWGEEYYKECHYKSELEIFLEEAEIEFSEICVEDGKYIVSQPNGIKSVFVVVENEDDNTFEFQLEETPLPIIVGAK